MGAGTAIWLQRLPESGSADKIRSEQGKNQQNPGLQMQENVLRFLHTKNPWKKRVHVRTAPQRNPWGDRSVSGYFAGTGSFLS